MKRLLHIIDSLAVGGAEKLLAGTINGLKNDYEQHLIILKGPETLLAEITAPCEFTNLNCTSFSNLFLQTQKVKSYIKKNRIEIVHSHLYEANLLARLATPKSVRLINSIHAISSLASYKINRLSLHLEKITYKKRHELIAVSKAVLDDFDEWVKIKGKAEVLYNFIDEKYFTEKPKTDYSLNQLKLVAIGNLRWQKNYPYLLEAFKKIKGPVSLDIYGQGPMQDELQEIIDKNNLPVKLCGVNNHLDKILPNYDAFVMASFYEGQPVSLLEATALGLPVLLADIPVLKETAGNNAVYFDIKNTESFCNAVNEIMTGKFNLQKMSEENRLSIEGFAHKEQFLNRLNQIYLAT
jgi:glycosyltransferase involved in cell wall biosynthesis